MQKEFDLPEEEEDSNRPPVKVACITGDYAMQRVLLQMNMNLFSMDGEHIKRINNFVMRCHACYQITTDLSKQFCPKCGGNTLMRTTTSIDQNGNMTYYLKKNFKYRLRGTKVNIFKLA
jgi:RNA-binding protein NOB1